MLLLGHAQPHLPPDVERSHYLFHTAETKGFCVVQITICLASDRFARNYLLLTNQICKSPDKFKLREELWRTQIRAHPASARDKTPLLL